ncbi:MAG: hypothetical protein HW387_966 [Parachlamydiales bacterium]|nr:hypothetical protein [Parachlamydiales bacterium]
MPETIKFERYSPTPLGISQRVALSENDTKNLTRLDQELRKQDEFRSAAQKNKYQADQVIYMVERIRNRYLLRFLSSIYDPGTEIEVKDLGLLNLLNQFFMANSESQPRLNACDRQSTQPNSMLENELTAADLVAQAKLSVLETLKKETSRQLESAQVELENLNKRLSLSVNENKALLDRFQQTISEMETLRKTHEESCKTNSKLALEEPLLQKEGILSPLKDAVRQSRIPQNKIACLDQSQRRLLERNENDDRTKLLQDKAQASAEQQQKSINNFQFKIEKLKAEKQKLEEKNSSNNDIINIQIVEIEGLASESRNTEKTICDLNNQIERLYDNLNTATEERDESKARLLSANDEITGLKSRLEQLTKYNQDLYHEYTTLAESKNILENKLLTQENDLADLKTSEEQSKKYYNQEYNKRDSLQADFEELQSRYNFVICTIENLSAQKREIENELDSSQKVRGRLLREQKNSRSVNDSLYKTIITSEDKIRVLTQENERLSHDNNCNKNTYDKLNQNIIEKELNIRTLSEKLFALEAEIETLKNDSQTARAKYDKNLDILNQNNQALTSQLKEKTQKIILFDVIKRTNTELKEQLESLKIKYLQVSSSQKEDQTNQQIHLASFGLR